MCVGGGALTKVVVNDASEAKVVVVKLSELGALRQAVVKGGLVVAGRRGGPVVYIYSGRGGGSIHSPAGCRSRR